MNVNDGNTRRALRIVAGLGLSLLIPQNLIGP